MTKKKTLPEGVKLEESKVEEPVGQKQEELVVDQTNTVASAETSATVVQDHTSIVIPYCKEFAQGKELLFALRSWQEHVRFGANIVIVGDREDWFSEEVNFIEHKRVSDNPQIDVMEKLQLAVASAVVTDRFIWSNDDIYLCNPVSLAHIELPKVLGMLDPAKFKGTYAANMSRTIDLLNKYGLPKFNYGTHTPVLFEKFRLGEMFDRFTELQSGALISSLYFNFVTYPSHPTFLDWPTDQVLLPVASKNPDEKKVVELLARKVFLNNAATGYSPWLEDFLSRLFPEPSYFEA